MLNWARLENVQRIVRLWLAHPLIDDYIVFSNSGTMPQLWTQVTQVVSNKDLGMRSRFLATLMAKNDCVLIQDDDILLSPAAVSTLADHWTHRPDVIHGIFGRQPKADGSYARLVDKKDARVDVVLTRALVAHRDNAVRFFTYEHLFPMLKTATPVGNGEDIVFSYVAKAHSGKLNEVHAVAFNELPAPQSIHHRVTGHWEHRTRVMRAASHWCNKMIEQNQS